MVHHRPERLPARRPDPLTTPAHSRHLALWHPPRRRGSRSTASTGVRLSPVTSSRDRVKRSSSRSGIHKSPPSATHGRRFNHRLMILPAVPNGRHVPASPGPLVGVHEWSHSSAVRSACSMPRSRALSRRASRIYRARTNRARWSTQWTVPFSGAGRRPSASRRTTGVRTPRPSFFSNAAAWRRPSVTIARARPVSWTVPSS
jgi:hypothetical protein